MGKILIIDDDKKICDITSKYLIHSGFEVTNAFNGKEAEHCFETTNYCLIILDIMLPDTNGYILLRNLREGIYMQSQKSTDKDVPVIMLTALGQTQDIIKGLKAGSDDYITKPFEPAELVERVKVILKRSRIYSDNELEIGNIKINLTSQTVKCNSMNLNLQRRENDLFIYLCKNKNKVFSREELLNAVWGYDFEGSDRAVDICIQRIRTKISELGSNVRIKTIWGTGYRLEDKNV